MIRISIDSAEREAEAGDRLIEAIDRAGVQLPRVCYHSQPGPIPGAGDQLVDTLTEAFLRTFSTAWFRRRPVEPVRHERNLQPVRSLRFVIGPGLPQGLHRGDRSRRQDRTWLRLDGFNLERRRNAGVP